MNFKVNKKIIAITFVLIMVLSGLAALDNGIATSPSLHQRSDTTELKGSKIYSQNPIDVGQPFTVTASTPFSNESHTLHVCILYASNDSCLYTKTIKSTTLNSMTYTFSQAGGYVIGIEETVGTVTDSPPGPGTLTVYSLFTHISTSATSLDLGQSISLGSSISGGTSPYTYSWSVAGVTGSFSNSTGSSTTFTPSTAGTATIKLSVTDSNGHTATTTTNITVDSTPTFSVTASLNPSDSGQSITYNTATSGGSDSYSYSYILYDGISTSDSELASGSTSSFSYTYSTPGSYLLVYNMTDSNAYKISQSLTQTVNSDPSVSIISSQNPTDTGKNIEFSSSVSGGTSPYNYTWIVDGNTYYTKDVNFTFTSPGSYIVDLTVTDSAGYAVSTSLSQTVNADPTVTATSNVSSADINYPIAFTSTPSAGTGPYSYSWTLNSNVISTSQDFTYSFTSSGTYTLTVTVTDSVGVSVSATVSVSINSNPVITAKSSENPTDVGNSVTFTSSLSGGTGSDTYVWTINGAEASTEPSFSYSFSSTGTYYVNITVTDSDGHVATYSLKEVVNPDPSVIIQVNHNPTDVGVAVNFTSSISGGTGPYNYSWSINEETYYTSSVNYTFAAAGTFSIILQITDANGDTASYSISEVVNADPTVSISTEYNPTDEGINDTLDGIITGGTGPYLYSWSLGSTIINTSESFHYAFPATGTYVVNLTITDNLGEIAHTSVTVTVRQKPTAGISGPSATDVKTSTYWSGYGSYGVAPYTYSWLINNVSTASGLYLDYSFPTTGKYYITLIINDSTGDKAYAHLTVQVNTLPTVSVSSSVSHTDIGYPVLFTSNIKGGTPYYNYTWDISSIGYVGYQQNLTYEFSSPGTYTVSIIIYDGPGNTASKSISIVISPLPSVTVHSQYTNIDPNVADTFNASITGGVSPYTIIWYVNNTVVDTNVTSMDYSFASPGTYTLEVKVIDSIGASSTSYQSITVVSYPEDSIIVAHSKVDTNVPDTFRASGIGGIGPYSYEWIIAGGEYSNSTVTYVFHSSGTYPVQLVISDSFGKDATVTTNVSVYPDPVVSVHWFGNPVASQEFPLYANISDGIAPYSVSWIFQSGQHESGLNITHVFSNSGSETFEVEVSDKGGYTATKNYTIHVNLYVSITSSTRSGLGPLTVQFSSSVLGGSDYSYNWTFSPDHYSLQQNPEYSFSVGNYTVHFKVMSANGAVGYGNITIQSLPAPVILTYSSGLNITQTFNFTAKPNWDAHGPFHMSWSFPNGQTLSGLSILYRFPAYNELNTVISTFTYGNNKTYTKELTVRMIPATPSITFSPPTIIPVDTMLSLNATASSPDSNSFTYSWLIDGSSYSGQNQLYYFDNHGNISISVTVTDSLGASSTVNKTIDVVPEGKSSSIALSYTKKSVGPMEFYNIKVVSSNGIVAVEAFLSTTELNISEISSAYTSSGEVAHYNLTMDQRDYSVGTYSISVVAFNNNSQSNHISVPFTVSSNYAATSGFTFGDVISFFGGISNFIIVLLTLAGLLFAYVGLRASRDPNVVIQEGTGKKKRNIVLQGRRER